MGALFLMIKKILARAPIVGSLAAKSYVKMLSKRFNGSEKYWIERYASGGSSGAGSYNKSAEFKAEVLNTFIMNHDVKSCIEYGCGDGNQLKLATYQNYLGFDVSPDAVALCRKIFHADKSKKFKMMKDYNGERAELTLSLDVIYHLIEDDVFEAYMRRLFDSSDRFVIIFSSNIDEQREVQAPHVRYRKFTTWISRNFNEWKLIQHIPNKCPGSDLYEGPSTDFYIYAKDFPAS
jgi:SAM-dependent methyltransferase